MQETAWRRLLDWSLSYPHDDAPAEDLLNQNFNPVDRNEVRAGDITYLQTDEGWMYLAIIMDLYSRRIVGWHIDKRMTKDLGGKT